MIVISVVLGFTIAAAGTTFASVSSDPKTIEVAEPMEYVRLYADSTGASHFADERLTFTLADFAPPAPPVSVSDAIQSEGVAFISSPAGWVGDWHPAPRRQYLIFLTGQLEVEVSDGEIRTFGPGAVVLVEDTWGKGHVSRVIGEARGYAIVVPLKEK
jgi:hypothetical protein